MIKKYKNRRHKSTLNIIDVILIILFTMLFGDLWIYGKIDDKKYEVLLEKFRELLLW